MIKKEKYIFEALIERSPFALAVLGPDLSVEYINPVLERISGYSIDEFKNLDLPEDLFKKEFNPKLSSVKNYIEEEIDLQGIRLDLSTKHGDIKHILWDFNFIRDDSSKVISIIVFGKDITKYLFQDKIMDSLFVGMGDAFTRLDRNGNLILYNDAALTLYDLPKGFNMKGINPILKYSQNTEKVLKLFEKLKKDGELNNQEIIIKTSNGTLKTVLLNARVIKDSSGRIKYVDGILHDISIIKEYIRELSENRDVLESLVDNIPLGVFAKDVRNDYRFTIWNKTMEKIFDLSSDKFIGKNDFDMFPEDEAKYFRQTDENIIKNGYRIEIEDEVVTSQKGVKKHTRVKKAPIYDRDGNPLYLVGIIQDISDELKQKQLLWDAKEKAEEANKAKSLFISNMSHEIRTPLNGVLGLIDILKTTNLDKDQRELVDLISSSGNLLNHLIADILDFSRIESGKLELRNSPNRLHEVVDSIKQTFQFSAFEKGLYFNIDVNPKTPECLNFDKLRLQQILINLIGNSIKYTEEGRIDLYISHKKFKNKDLLNIVVKDTGVGIDRKSIKNIFEVFKQIDDPRIKRHPGAGLGLSITKRLVSLMGGTITVESEPGIGTTFNVQIPVLIEEPEFCYSKIDNEINQHAKFKYNDLNILVAEDNTINQIMLKKTLKGTFKKLDLALNGKMALDYFNKNDYDIIFMDIHMPEMDGINTTKIIREKEVQENRKKSIIIAVTADAFKEVIDDLIKSGFDDVITKPFKKKDIINSLLQYTSLEIGLVNNIDSKGIKRIDKEYLQINEKVFNEYLEDAPVEAFIDITENFHDSYKNFVKDIREYIEKEDFKNIEEKAHKFKGVVSFLHCEKILRILVDLQESGKDHNIENSKILLKKLLPLLKELSEDVIKLQIELTSK